jgi:hypothetical protein
LSFSRSQKYSSWSVSSVQLEHVRHLRRVGARAAAASPPGCDLGEDATRDASRAADRVETSSCVMRIQLTFDRMRSLAGRRAPASEVSRLDDRHLRRVQVPAHRRQDVRRRQRLDLLLEVGVPGERAAEVEVRRERARERRSCARPTCRDCSQPDFASAISFSSNPSFRTRAISSCKAASSFAEFCGA